MATFARPTAALLALAAAAAAVAVLGGGAEAQQLSPNFYSSSCPSVATIVRRGMASAVQKERRMGASILRFTTASSM